MIKFVSELRQIGGFSPLTPVYSTNKTHRYGITEILLKVAQTIDQMFAILVATIELLYLFFLTSTHATLSLRKVIYGGFFFFFIGSESTYI